MADDKQSGRKDMVEAVQGVLQAVPIYQDAIQPAARELGEGLSSIMHLAFTPVRRFRAYIEYGDATLARRLQEKLQDTPPERLVEPKVSLALPALLGWASTEADEPLLADMYAALLATAMDAETAQRAHPAYAHIIGQMVPDEALVLKHAVGMLGNPLRCGRMLTDDYDRLPLAARVVHAAGARCPDLAEVYHHNLTRLGLWTLEVTTIEDRLLTGRRPVPDNLLVAAAVVVVGPGPSDEYAHHLGLTDFCLSFARACLPGSVHTEPAGAQTVVPDRK